MMICCFKLHWICAFMEVFGGCWRLSLNIHRNWAIFSYDGLDHEVNLAMWIKIGLIFILYVILLIFDTSMLYLIFFDFIISPNSSSILFPLYICSDLVTGQPFFSKSLNSFYIYIFWCILRMFLVYGFFYELADSQAPLLLPSWLLLLDTYIQFN